MRLLPVAQSIPVMDAGSSEADPKCAICRYFTYEDPAQALRNARYAWRVVVVRRGTENRMVASALIPEVRCAILSSLWLPVADG